MNHYDANLDKNAANYVPLTPLSFLERAKDVYPNYEAIVYEDRKYTWNEVYKRAIKFASALEKIGIKKGDTVSFLAFNTPEIFDAHYSVPMTGAVLNTINIRLDANTISYILNHSDAKVLVVDRQLHIEVKKALSKLDKKITVIDIHDKFADQSKLEKIGDLEYEKFLSTGDDSYVWKMPEDEWQAISLSYTSGTTGTPKGVMTSHRSMIANSTLQMLQGAAVSQHSSSYGIDWSKNTPTSLLTSPLFHVSGLSAGAVTSLFAGSTTLVYDGRFLADKVIKLIQKFSVTSWGGAVPTALKRLLDEAEAKNLTLESVLVVGGGGAPMPPELIERTKGVFPNSEYSFGYGYGLTESGAITIINWGETLKAEPSSPGQSMPSIKIELRDEEGKLITADSVEGEIHVQSPSVMLGYYNNPEASAAALTNDRWLRTGDWGYKKGSLYFISSRRTDLILRGAENVYPQEIELILDSHKDIEESAVIGIPHDDLGQEVMAIVSTKNSQLSDSELSAWVGKDLADFKVPSKWKMINTPLPRNASGKLMKHVLIDTSKNTMVEEDE